MVDRFFDVSPRILDMNIKRLRPLNKLFGLYQLKKKCSLRFLSWKYENPFINSNVIRRQTQKNDHFLILFSLKLSIECFYFVLLKCKEN